MMKYKVKNQNFRKKQSGLSFGFLVTFLIVFLPNIFMLILVEWLKVDRPLVNFDYAMMCFLLVLCPRPFVLIFFFGAFFVDALSLIRQVFPVASIQDSIYLLGFIGVAPFYYQLAFLFFLSVSVLFFVLVWVSVKYLSRTVVVVVFNCFLVVYVFGLIFDSGHGGDFRTAPSTIMHSQFVAAYEAGMNGFIEQFSESASDVFEKKRVKGASFSWLENPEDVGDKILLVVSESWGWSDKEIMRGVLAPLMSKLERLSEFETGRVGVLDVTVQGEIRELCGLRPVVYNLKHVDGGFSGCLPNIYKDLGYRTLSLHAATGAMYARRFWYPNVGFDEMVFFEDRKWPKRCYSFPGACDEDVLPDVVNFFSQNDKAFAYWLTLNTHAPYDLRDLNEDVFDCVLYGIDESTDSCRNLKLHAQFFLKLSELIDEPAMKGVRILVVGDHAPLIVDGRERNKFIKHGSVSWVSFVVGPEERYANIEN